MFSVWPEQERYHAKISIILIVFFLLASILCGWFSPDFSPGRIESIRLARNEMSSLLTRAIEDA